MIEITPSISIDEKELQLDYVRASGPGGQNVNKVSTAAQLRFDVHNSPSLEAGVKERLGKKAGSRMTDSGILIIIAKRHRTREQNRLDAVQRLVSLIQAASEIPRVRKATRPSFSAKAARLGDKKKHGQKKSIRHGISEEWD